MSNMVGGHLLHVNKGLIIAAKTGGDLGYLEIIEEMDRVLTKAIEDFDRAVNAEVLQISIGRAKRGREEQEPAKQEPAEQEPAGQEVLFPPNGCPDHGDEGAQPSLITCHNGLSYALTH